MNPDVFEKEPATIEISQDDTVPIVEAMEVQVPSATQDDIEEKERKEGKLPQTKNESKKQKKKENKMMKKLKKAAFTSSGGDKEMLVSNEIDSE